MKQNNVVMKQNNVAESLNNVAMRQNNVAMRQNNVAMRQNNAAKEQNKVVLAEKPVEMRSNRLAPAGAEWPDRTIGQRDIYVASRLCLDFNSKKSLLQATGRTLHD
jgi:hypothetical protein